MSAINNGGPAFPNCYPNDAQAVALGYPREVRYSGLTLRDYFAAKAMTSLLTHGQHSRQEVCKALGITSNQFEEDPDGCLLRFFARHAYQIADAMIAARES